MDDEVYSFALKNTLDEVQKICPDIKTAFVLGEDHELIAKDENTSESTITGAVHAFEEILEKAEVLGGMENMVIEGANGRVNVSHMDKIYLVTVVSRKADLNYLNNVTHVLVPTILKLIERLHPAPFNKQTATFEREPEIQTIENTEEPAEQLAEETEAKEEDHSTPEEEEDKILPEPPINQFIVEDLKGLLTPSDTVRIDSRILEQWNELYEGRSVEEAEIETFSGKSVQCKVKPMKDLRLEGQGKIQIPSKVQLTLEIQKGELVRVKPLVK